MTLRTLPLLAIRREGVSAPGAGDRASTPFAGTVWRIIPLTDGDD